MKLLQDKDKDKDKRTSQEAMGADALPDFVRRLEEVCTQRFVKLTWQRRLIAHILAQLDHPSVEEVHQNAMSQNLSIGYATIYRTVRLFKNLGLLHQHTFDGGKARYEHVKETPHHHLIDTHTGNVIEFDSLEFEKLSRTLALNLGYELVGHRIELYGEPFVKNSDTKNNR